MTALLELHELTVEFPVAGRRGLSRGPRTVLRAADNVTLAVERGDALGLVGESGSGKSTVAKAIVGLVAPTSGRILFDGKQLGVRRDSGTRRRAQMVFQDPNSSLDPAQTVEQALSELIRYHALVPRDSVRSRCVELLKMVELPPSILRAYPRQMSGGQRQRVAIARALAVEPDLLIADEAVAALDVSVQAAVIQLLMRLRRELGLTMILISHDLAVVRHACDRVAVMYLGRIVEVGSTKALFSDARHPYTQALLRAVPHIGERRRSPALLGELPSSLAVPPGCRFHPRCPVAEFPLCSEAEPSLEGLAGHVAACHFAWRNSDQVVRRAVSESR